MSDAFANEPFGSDPFGDGGGVAPGAGDPYIAGAADPFGGGGGGDIWDFGSSDDYSTLADPSLGTMGFENYSDIAQDNSAGSSTSPLLIVLLVLLLGLGGYLAWDYSQTGENPFADFNRTIESWIADLMGSDTNVATAPPPVDEEPIQRIVEPEPEPIVDLDSIPPPPNPYWELPNKVVTVAKPQTRGWNPEEEEGFRLGLSSRYTYQRYKAVQDVRKSQLRGSETILWDALQEPKLWTRMWAIVGLAEFGIEISVDTVERALGTERSHLIANFFKRFIAKNNAGSLYVLRQALKLVDDRSRVIIHKALWRAGKRNPYRNLYIVAATYDPGPRVQRFARRILRRRPMSEAEFIKHQRVVLGVDEAEDVAPVVEPNPTKPLPAVVEEPSAETTEPPPAVDPVPVDSAPVSPVAEEADEYDESVEFYDMVSGEGEAGGAGRPAGLKDTFDLEETDP